MIPPIHSPRPSANVPTDGHTPSGGVSRDTFPQACARNLNSPVIVTDIGDGALLVEPLRFHPVIRRHGRNVVRKSHHHGGLNG